MRSLLVLFLLWLASPALLAQSTSQASQSEPSVQSLLDRIQKMEQRISELEEHERKELAAQTGNPALPAPADQQPAQATAGPTPSPSQALHSEHGTNPTEVREAEVHYPSLQIRGFGDVDFQGTDQKGSTSGFSLGQLDLHFASPLSRKISYFGEVTFTAQPNTYELNVERSFVRFDYNDYFKISFGKFHTPIGYWNTAYHHGAWLQTTIIRPQMIKFGGAFTPVHIAGLQAEGSIPSGGLGLRYSLALGNGRNATFSKAGDSGDVNNNRAWLAQLSAQPSRLYGLELGGSYYHDELTPKPGVNFREWIAGGYVSWTKGRPELLAEYENVHHTSLETSLTFNTTGYYAQVAYRLPWQENKWKPYYRFEYIHRPNQEPVWDITGTSSVEDLVGSLVGVRWDITNFACFKGEYRKFRQATGTPSVNGAFFQSAFTF
jgi:hypothetical protein